FRRAGCARRCCWHHRPWESSALVGPLLSLALIRSSTGASAPAAFLFLEAGEALAFGQLLPDFRGLQVAIRPEHEEMIKQVGRFRRRLALFAAHALDHRLDGFLAQFLGDLLRALGEQPGGVGAGRVRSLAAFNHLIEPVEYAGIQRPSRILRHRPYPLDFDDSSLTDTTH